MSVSASHCVLPRVVYPLCIDSLVPALRAGYILEVIVINFFCAIICPLGYCVGLGALPAPSEAKVDTLVFSFLRYLRPRLHQKTCIVP
jgi:hypothetical protein